MGRPKGSKNKTTGKRFKKCEGRYSQDRHIRLTKDMLMDERFLKLPSSAVKLYLYMKMWAAGRDETEFSASMASKLMSKPTYMKARDALISAGFIEYVNKHRARDMRETALFEFSDRWQCGDRPLTIRPAKDTTPKDI